MGGAAGETGVGVAAGTTAGLGFFLWVVMVALSFVGVDVDWLGLIGFGFMGSVSRGFEKQEAKRGPGGASLRLGPFRARASP